MTRVGVGLNLLILTNGQKKLFTVDLVPAIQVNVADGFDGLKLRQVLTLLQSGLTMKLLNFSYIGYHKKYFESEASRS